MTSDLLGEDSCFGPLSWGTVVNPLSPASSQKYQMVVGNIALLLPLGYAVNYLFLDCKTSNSGLGLVLKGTANDVGVTLSSTFPSLIPVSNTYSTITGTNVDDANVTTYSFANTLSSQVWIQSFGTGTLDVVWL